MSEKKVLKKNTNIVTRVIGGEVILLPVYKASDEINCIYTLNKCASRAWELINGKRDLFDIKKVILEEFGSTQDEVDKELDALLADLKQIKAVL